MIKKLAVLSLVILGSSSLAFADGINHKMGHHKHKHHKVRSEGYKGEVAIVPVQQEIAAVTYVPSYTIAQGTYLGLSVGSLANNTSKPAFYQGLAGTVTLGYAYTPMTSYYLAGEAFVGDSIQLQNKSNNGSSVRSSWNLGLSVLPGYMISEAALGYFRLGYIRTNFSSPSNSANGAQLGLGLQLALSKSWDVRSEYIYSFYNSVSTLGNPRSNLFNLGFIYKCL